MPSILRGVLVSAALLSAGDDPFVLADFPGSLADLRWRVVDDGVMGGRSEGSLRSVGDALVFEGTTNTDGGGFSSIRSDTRRFDLGAHAGVRLRVRGDGRTYTFRLTTWDTREGRLLSRLDYPHRHPRHLAWSAAGLLASTNMRDGILLWEVARILV